MEKSGRGQFTRQERCSAIPPFQNMKPVLGSSSSIASCLVHENGLT